MSVNRHRGDLCAPAPRWGFTFIELLAALSATAIAVGATFTAVRGARSASQLEVCLDNLRVIAAASAQYSADDPGEQSIPVHHKINVAGATTVIGDYQYGGKSGNVNQAADFIYTIEGGYGSLSRPLNPYLYDVVAMTPPDCRDLGGLGGIPAECSALDKSLPLYRFRCPSDTGKTGLHYSRWGTSGRTGFDYFGTSYNANVSMYCDGDLFSNSPFQRPRSQVPNPSRTIQYMETNGRFAWAWGYGPWGYGTGFTVGGWHGEDWKFNMVFMDGSARYTEMKGASPNGTGIVDGPDDVEYVPGLPGGINNWWQIILRGRDWQIDTLPAPVLPTRKLCN